GTGAGRLADELRPPREHAPDALLRIDDDPVADSGPRPGRRAPQRARGLEPFGRAVEDEAPPAAAVLGAHARGQVAGLELQLKMIVPTQERELLVRMHHGAPSFGSRSRIRDGAAGRYSSALERSAPTTRTLFI